ncbi:acyl-CoA dehydrogenase family protein [Mycolicibacterium pyrenivorans]|uniref:acyl-CoA dehydrogenase family protein n=1 Tax=Mycolicibacterium pyrenivorans TaxID=187102 RepID=UPI0021F37FE4|nr:acyl-CoA dehydrogenase family protein [Mycolicibacterium pyrenivorans]MCV7151256.1 acyl-CoA dehydrogenase family protein [Mycolicibacterium pyrenivorans]
MTVTTEEFDDYRDSFRSWLGRAPLPEVLDSEDEQFSALREWQGVLYKAGYLGVNWPRDWGGQGLSVRHQLVVIEELDRAHAPHPAGLVGLEVVGPSIGRFGTPEQRATLLPKLLSGEDIWCQGFSEPGAGSDLASLNTRAVREGDDFIINGQKVWTTHARQASWCAVLARTDSSVPKHRGISYLLADMNDPGITVRPLVQLTGDTEFNEVFFDNVRVPASNLLGDLGAGWTIAMDTLSHERGTFAVRRRADLTNSFHRALDHLERPQDLPEHLVAGIGVAETALRTLRAQTWAILKRLEVEESAPGDESIDKTVLTNVEQQVGHCLRDLLGRSVSAWDAETRGASVGTALRDYLYSRACSIYGGTQQIQRNIIAQRHLGMPRD